MKEGWTKYDKMVLAPNANCMYQKEIVKDVFVDVLEYTNPGVWEAHVQIPEDKSIVGMTINTVVFAYNKLDFDKIEAKAKVIIRQLTK